MTPPPPSPTNATPGRERSGGRWLVRLAVLGLLIVATGAGAGWLAMSHYEEGLPSVADLKGNYRPPQVTRVLARDGMLLAELFTERRTVIAIGTLPAHVKLAVLAGEDAAFYEHEGLNYWGMLRALVVNLRSGRTRQGGSTITQQVVKNLLLDPERSYARKVREVILARRLEQELSKDEILELYLNHIYFGHGRYGIEEAARYYFGKPAKDLTLAEAALLAGMPAGPELYSPRHDLTRAMGRRGFVLGQMLEKGFIDQRQHDVSMTEPVRLAPAVEAQAQLAPEAVEIAKRVLREVAGPGSANGGYTITTTIDPRLQAAARKAVRDNLDAYDKRYKLIAPFKPPVPSKQARAHEKPFEGTPRYGDHRVLVGVVTAADDASGTLEVRVGTALGTVKLADYERYNPQHLAPSLFAPPGTLLHVSVLSMAPASATTPAHADGGTGEIAPGTRAALRLDLGPEGAMVALDVRTREVLALVGSYEAIASGLDRATQAHRQPGSSFKPIVYSDAITTRRFTASSMLQTDPGSLTKYRPNNFEDSEGAVPMRLREALAHSVNVAAVHVLEDLGPANVVGWAGALGIGSRLGADLSLALGSYEVTPIELVAAYATFAAGGTYQAPLIVTKIVGPDGRELELPPRPPERRVMGEAEAYLTTSLLTSVVDHGTGAAAKAVGRPVAGKTGTSNQAKDAWFVGYSPDIVCGVWTGFDDGRSLGAREQGATAALPSWIAFMRAAHEGRPKADFAQPAGLVVVRIDPSNGLRVVGDDPNAIDEIFLSGTEPTEISPGDAGVSTDGGLTTGTEESEEHSDDDAGADDAGSHVVLDPTPPF